MSSSRGIIVFGVNGSGKTAIGRELARILNFKHIDHEDYAFVESDIPYTNECSHDEYVKLMLTDIESSVLLYSLRLSEILAKKLYPGTTSPLFSSLRLNCVYNV